jgi:hypothetical protein
VVNQATQPAYSLVKEGRELAGVDSLSLRPYIAQLGGFRIESYSPECVEEEFYEVPGQCSACNERS